MCRKVEGVAWNESDGDGTEDLGKGGDRVFPMRALCIYRIPLEVRNRILTARHSLNVTLGLHGDATFNIIDDSPSPSLSLYSYDLYSIISAATYSLCPGLV